MRPQFTAVARFFSYCVGRVVYKRRIAKFLGLEISHVDRFYKEINDSEFMRDITRKAQVKSGFFDFNMAMVLRAPTLYIVCRIHKPEIVVETGVADGFSAAFILQALETNKKGHLYSIDLPNQAGQILRDGKATGWLVPDILKKRWTLIFGSSKEELPQLLVRLRKIDIFFHDSEHTYGNMMFEFNTVRDYLDKKGLVISDDITDSDAFDTFCREAQFSLLRLFKTGIARRNNCF